MSSGLSVRTRELSKGSLPRRVHKFSRPFKVEKSPSDLMHWQFASGRGALVPLAAPSVPSSSAPRRRRRLLHVFCAHTPNDIPARSGQLWSQLARAERTGGAAAGGGRKGAPPKRCGRPCARILSGRDAQQFAPLGRRSSLARSLARFRSNTNLLAAGSTFDAPQRGGSPAHSAARPTSCATDRVKNYPLQSGRRTSGTGATRDDLHIDCILIAISRRRRRHPRLELEALVGGVAPAVAESARSLAPEDQAIVVKIGAKNGATASDTKDKRQETSGKRQAVSGDRREDATARAPTKWPENELRRRGMSSTRYFEGAPRAN